MLEKWFRPAERGSSVAGEIMAGITTFLTMLYIVVVNPAILGAAGMDFNGVFVATVLSSVVASLIMGIFANYPIVIAPGMGMNAYFAYSVVLGGGHSWQAGLGAVFIAGIFFLLLSLTKFRYLLIDSIPASLKHAITSGIGLFITFIGLQNAKIIVASPATLVTLGKLSEPMPLLTIFGLAVSLTLMLYRVKGFLFFGILATAVMAYFSRMLTVPEQWLVWPGGLAQTALQMDIGGVFEQGLYAVVFTFLLVTLFDTTGTMLGVAEQAGLLKDGKFPRVRGALLADALGTAVGAALGTSPTSAYVESATGVAAGARTGLAAVTVAALLLATLFFSPVAKMLSAVPAVTAPAIILVGFFMMEGLRNIDWKDAEEAFPAFLILIAMPLTYSIATGIGVGFIAYPILKVVRGRAREVSPLLYFFALLFFVQIGFFSH